MDGMVDPLKLLERANEPKLSVAIRGVMYNTYTVEGTVRNASETPPYLTGDIWSAIVDG